ncbi:hypothetical protein HYS03_01710 [Candidatus Woesebacteria bacterium]|nr:hypothetical protein [Candidatus Woesebacteria bacterium]QQG47842.1 MAG: hypothetical protein HY044_02000 [Candidatus Woesebacteria bacterium]
MFSKTQLEIICKGLPAHYERVDLDVLMEVVKKAAHDAEENFKKLPSPKTRSLFSYVSFWVNAAVVFNEYNSNIGVIVRELEEKDEQYRKAMNRNIKVQSEYMEKVLPEPNENDKWLNEKTLNIVDIWNELDKRVATDAEAQILKDYLPIFEGLKPRYVNLVKSRNQLAKTKGFKNQTDRSAGNRVDYQYFLDNREKVINYCQKQIPEIKLPNWFYSQFNNQWKHGFLSLLPNFPEFTFPNGVLDFVVREYPILDKFKDRIKIKLADRNSQAYYVKEIDSFDVVINKKVNRRQQIVELIHELGDIIGDLKSFETNWNSDSKWIDSIEFNPYWIEFKLLKKLSPEVYRARVADVLNNIADIAFLIEAYENPDQDLPKLYAVTFNHLFPIAKQTKNYTYLIKKHMTFHPFSTLSQTIAQVKVLSESLDK